MYQSIHHSFDVNLATEFSIEEAVLIHHFQHWVSLNKRLNKNFIDGRTWTYQTREEIAAHFPYLSYKEVRLITEKLVRKKVLINCCFAKNKFNRTLWYAFNDEEKFLKKIETNSNSSYDCPNGQMQLSERANPSVSTGKCIYTDTKTDTETDKKEIYKERSNKKIDKEPEPFVLKLSDEEKMDLENKFGKDLVECKILGLENYCENKNRVYKSHYKTIRNWCMEDVRKEKARKASSPMAKKEEIIQKNTQLAVEFLKKNEELYRLSKINKISDPRLGPGLEIQGPSNAVKVVFCSENAFLDQVYNACFKMNHNFKKLGS